MISCGDRDDRLGAPGVERSELEIGFRRRPLDDARARAMSGRGMRSSPMRKLLRERSVCAPQ